MSITMMEHATGMALPRCAICGKDVFCRDVSSMQEVQVQANSGMQIAPHGLNCDLVGDGLRRDDFTCSTCLRAANLTTTP